MVIGIDPGFSGAICRISKFGGVELIDMPLTEPSKLNRWNGGSQKRSIDGTAIIQWLKGHHPELIVIEKVHSMPEQGVASTFAFGEGYGLIQGILIGLEAPKTIKVPPSVWKASMGVTWEKRTSIEMAKRLVNESVSGRHFTLKKHDGRAEALLLAFFGAKSLGWDLSVFLGEKTRESTSIW